MGQTGDIHERVTDDDDLSDNSYVSAASMLEQLDVKRTPPILQLPTEIILHIFSYLDCEQLVSLTRTCHQLKANADEDLLWLMLLRKHIPPQDFPSETPYPAPTYRHLYTSHHPYWFLPRNKLWISDEPHVGKIMLCKFDPRRGCIEGYRLLADRGLATGTQWVYKPEVLIHNFTPRVHLWLDDPVLRLPHEIPSPTHGKQGWWEGEIKMSVGRSGHNTSASFFLTRNIPERYQAPNMELWPPRTIPDMPRVRASSQDKFRGKGHKPQSYSEISQTTFRMRQWSQFFTGLAHVGVRLGEEVSTWSTIDPSLYTPTKEKPYQGIFVGDYAGHGCEFLLVMQTKAAPPLRRRSQGSQLDPRMESIIAAMRDQASEAESSEAQAPLPSWHHKPVTPNLQDDVAHSGAIEAIKLTGDPNVPRGEHTFIADDIGPRGLIRIAAEEPFTGARVVKSRGQIALRGFVNDEYVPSQLFLISPDRLAQYWLAFGHISYYERIDINALLADTSSRRRASNDC